MKLKLALTAAFAVPLAMTVAPTSASADFLGIGKAVKSVKKTVSHAVSDTADHAGSVAKGAGRIAEGAANGVAKDTKAVVKATPSVAAGAVNVTGTVASKAYDKAGDVVGHVPVLKD
jgi:hypothetical protein